MAVGLGPTYKSKDTCLTPRVGPHGTRQGRSDGRRRRLVAIFPRFRGGENGMVVVTDALPQYQHRVDPIIVNL